MKIFKYYTTVILSVLSIVCILGGSMCFLFCMLKGTSSLFFLTGDSGYTFSQQIPKNTFFSSYGKYIYLIIASVGGIVYKPLENLRQKLRDEAEYDENGISHKYGHFIRLSAEERRKIEQQKMMDRERLLDSMTIKKITKKGEKNPETAMDRLIGLCRVKEQMHEMSARMSYEKENYKKQKHTLSSMHMCFMGPPGTGKTTCARIMTGFLYQNGYIRKNQCIEVDGNFFNGLSAGESSKRTQMLLDAAYGGVLFIDEAYAMLQGTGNGQEVIATLVKAMEDHRDDFILIIAGYSNEMKTLIDSNPGIESRIKHYMWFDHYQLHELCEIFRNMANGEGFCVSAEIMEEFQTKMLKEMNSPNFGNARTVRNYLDRTIDRHAVNIMDHRLDDSQKFILSDIDAPDDRHFR